MDTRTAYTQADAAVAAYDAFIFGSVGRPFDADRADLLGISAACDCDVAARDSSLNKCTRDHYRALAAMLRAMCA